MTAKRFHILRRSLVAVLAVSGVGAAVALQSSHASAGASNLAVPVPVQSSLEALYRIDVTPADLSTAPPINADEASNAAHSEFAWAGGGAAISYLVRFTDKNWGTVGDGSGPIIPDRSSVTPFYVNKLVWLVVIPSANIPNIPPHGKSKGPNTDVETLCVFVDPATGDFLKAVTT
jgi:hypothetical protein